MLYFWTKTFRKNFLDKIKFRHAIFIRQPY